MDTTPKPGPHPRSLRFVRLPSGTFVIYHADGRIAAVGKSKSRKKVNR